MSGFNDREQGFEKKYAHDEKLAFKIEARACKIFGLWLAAKMGLSDGHAYAMEVVASNLAETGFDDVLKKVATDLKAKNFDVSAHTLETQLNKALEEARTQIQNETK